VGVKSQRNVSFGTSRSRWEYTKLQFSVDLQDGKGKVVPVLNLYVSRHEDVSGNASIAPLFMTSALDGVEWSTSSPDRFNPGVRSPDAHWIEDWVGPRIGKDAVESTKLSCPCWESKPGGLTCTLSPYRPNYPLFRDSKGGQKLCFPLSRPRGIPDHFSLLSVSKPRAVSIGVKRAKCEADYTGCYQSATLASVQ
jgi:hypothetical protein